MKKSWRVRTAEMDASTSRGGLLFRMLWGAIWGLILLPKSSPVLLGQHISIWLCYRKHVWFAPRYHIDWSQRRNIDKKFPGRVILVLCRLLFSCLLCHQSYLMECVNLLCWIFPLNVEQFHWMWHGSKRRYGLVVNNRDLRAWTFHDAHHSGK